MERISGTFVPGLGPAERWTLSLTTHFRRLADALKLPLSHSARLCLEDLSAGMVGLIYSACLQRIEIEFADVVCDIRLDYDEPEADSDVLEVSKLRHVLWDVTDVSIRLFVTDVKYAAALIEVHPANWGNDCVLVQIIHCDLADRTSPPDAGARRRPKKKADRDGDGGLR